jgi:hypothetical protein
MPATPSVFAASVTVLPPATIWRDAEANSEADFGRPLYRPSACALAMPSGWRSSIISLLELRDTVEPVQHERAGRRCRVTIDRQHTERGAFGLAQPARKEQIKIPERYLLRRQG